jgi:hypothetical protein
MNKEDKITLIFSIVVILIGGTFLYFLFNYVGNDFKQQEQKLNTKMTECFDKVKDPKWCYTNIK